MDPVLIKKPDYYSTLLKTQIETFVVIKTTKNIALDNDKMDNIIDKISEKYPEKHIVVLWIDDNQKHMVNGPCQKLNSIVYNKAIANRLPNPDKWEPHTL